MTAQAASRCVSRNGKDIQQKKAEKPSQTLSNTTTQARKETTNTKQGMQKQQRNREEQLTQELTNIRPNTNYKVAASPNNTNQSPHIISQEEDDQEEANTHPAVNTRARRAHRCSPKSVQWTQSTSPKTLSPTPSKHSIFLECLS